MSPTDLPRSTYRLQVSAEFTLEQTAALADYVRLLGADWLYLSPLLQATRDSSHGYDVTDHGRVDEQRGGPEGLERAAAAARALDMGVLVDTVPNHMGVADPRQNVWWWQLLRDGREGRMAEAFDVDWAFGQGRLRIPVLGEELEQVVADGQVSLGDDSVSVYGTEYPLTAGSADDVADRAAATHDELLAVLGRQHYELVHWTRADADLNYRRFFAVNTLAAVRVEVPWVFEQSHAEIVRWVREGLVQGIRVDHPDGLLDPGGYLDDLAAATGHAPVWVEKILEGEEQLPAFWQAAGTTGYDALATIDRVLVDPAGRGALDALDAALRAEGTDAPAETLDWHALIRRTKRRIADTILRSEVLRLERELPAPVPEAADALAELLACFPVYRSYLPVGAEQLEQALTAARVSRPDLADAFDALAPLLADAAQPVAQRFQQTSGMVMAKGVEDTAFYRVSRLASLTEVGADPAEFAVDVDEFHRRQLVRQGAYPASLTALSTHDTKRGEDTRARIHVLAEIPEAWQTLLGELRAAVPLGDGPFENLLWESLVGAWPISAERAHAYAEKAAREAGTATTWTQPDEAFEARMHAAIDAVLEQGGALRALVEDFVTAVAPAGWSNGLAAKLLQIATPGVPDVYQGSELWETSLVDPDNRRPVDYDERRMLLARIDGEAPSATPNWMPGIDETAAAKLLVTSRALRVRRDRPELFTRYAPLPALGSAAAHAIVFDRGGAVAVATRLPVGLEQAGGWGDTVIVLPQRPVLDAFTGRRYDGGELRLAEVLGTYPVALLVEEESDR
ncbi:malto-oligosyltrehalose synthase [Microcella daejeonensis]|uniref:malto-oligosyltrehalose synthase n=1 Tax=Microcella daejeonensis TaxID=2994971 RepID=UPI00226E79C4|nr:malto-oligosyltrehalose synthase [Microcella daejeonensis]WAB84438.1 malto-oligosyltrehalose synthase [Microcella daejeonensis]